MKKKIQILMKGLLLAVLLVGSLTLASTSVFADDDVESVSFGLISQNAQKIISENTMNDVSGEEFKGLAGLASTSVGNAGLYVGYSPDGWFTSVLGGSSTLSYTTAVEVYGNNANINEYLNFGRTITDLGISEQAGELMNFNLGALLGGALLWVFYAFALLPTYLFDIAINVLQAMNPISWLTGSNSVISISGYVEAIGGFLTTIVLPILLISILLGKLLFNKGDTGRKFRQLLSRVLVVVLIFGPGPMLYDWAVESLDGSVASTDAPNAVILSTLFDYGAWAENNFLIDDDVHLSYKEATPDTYGVVDPLGYGGPSDVSVNDLRHYILELNSTSLSIEGLRSPFTSVDTTTSDDALFETTDENSFTSDGNYNTNNDVANDSATSSVTDLLNRYMGGGRYTPAMYESTKTAGLNKTDGLVDYLIELSNDDLTMVTLLTSDAEYVANDIFRDGTMSVDSNNTFTGALSTMSTYNLLGTAIEDTSVVTYDIDGALTGFSVQSHNDVTLAGSGLLGFMYWLSAIVVLATFGVIGVFYGLAIIFDVFVRTVRFFISMVQFGFGSVKAIKGIIVHLFMIIASLLITLMLYDIIMSMIFAIGEALRIGVSTSISGDFGLIAGLIVSCVFYIVAIFMSLRLRSSVIKGIEDGVGGFITKLLGIGNDAPNQPSMAKAMMGGAAQGALHTMTSNNNNHDEKRLGDKSAKPIVENQNQSSGFEDQTPTVSSQNNDMTVNRDGDSNLISSNYQDDSSSTSNNADGQDGNDSSDNTLRITHNDSRDKDVARDVAENGGFKPKEDTVENDMSSSVSTDDRLDSDVTTMSQSDSSVQESRLSTMSKESSSSTDTTTDTKGVKDTKDAKRFTPKVVTKPEQRRSIAKGAMHGAMQGAIAQKTGMYPTQFGQQDTVSTPKPKQVTPKPRNQVGQKTVAKKPQNLTRKTTTSSTQYNQSRLTKQSTTTRKRGVGRTRK